MSDYSAACTDSLALQDGVSELAIFAEACVDSFVLSDAVAENGTFPEACIDSLTLQDAVTEKGTFPEACVDSFVLQDAVSEVAIFQEASVDSFVLADANEATIILTGELAGKYRIADTSIVRWELWLGEDTDPDFTKGPDKTWSTNPAALTSVGFSPSHDYAVTIRKRSQYNLLSANIDITRFTLDGSGALVSEAPTDPYEIEAEAAANGNVTIRAKYNAEADGDIAADTWIVWITDDGTTPDAADLHTSEAMDGATACEQFELTTTDNFADGATIKIIVKVERASDSVQSDDETVHTVTANTTGPTIPDGELTLGGGAEL